MLGSILGDTIGSVYEFHNYRQKDFPLWNPRCRPTDDSVLTCAIAEALLESLPFDYAPKGIESLKAKVVASMVSWAKRYPDGGYGGRFAKWLRGYNGYKPYGSFGNGAAMRIGAIPYFAKSEEELKNLAKAVTEVTHDHPEGLKGAEAVALLTHKALRGASKEELYPIASSYYPRLASLDYETLRKANRFDETCQGSVPEALYCVFISNSYEETIRTAISIGGDSDTIACIAGGLAEALFGLPLEGELAKGLAYVPQEMKILCEKVYALR